MKKVIASTKWIILSLVALLLVFEACKKDVEIPLRNSVAQNVDISFAVPDGWPTPYYRFVNNQLTNAGFILGRKLFYEVKLSRDNTVSCGTCHQPFAAFANSDHPVSHGIDGLIGIRNSPGLFNLNWHPNFMWDGGINHIEVQPIAPIENPVEMGEKLSNVLAKLNADPAYRTLTENAFGAPELTSERMLKSLAQFMGAMVSANAKYDRYMRKEAGVTMTSSELAGLSVFESKCATCHKAPLFSDFSFRNAGVAPGSVNDSGRAHITRDQQDLYKFKVPSLRNLSYTAPYFHDGRASTIDDVLQQKQFGVFESPTLDPLMRGGIPLSAQERTDLKAFLKTLDDESFVKDSRFFEPR